MSPTEADARKAIDTLVGSWAVTFEEHGKQKTAKVTATPTGSDLALRLTWHEPDSQPANGMFAWDAANKQVVETWFHGDEYLTIRFDGMAADGGLFGLGEGTHEGERFTGLRVLTFHSSGHYTHAIRANVSAGHPLASQCFVYHRCRLQRLPHRIVEIFVARQLAGSS